MGDLISFYEDRLRADFFDRVQGVLEAIDRLAETMDRVDHLESLCGDWDANWRRRVIQGLQLAQGLLTCLELMDHAERRDRMAADREQSQRDKMVRWRKVRNGKSKP